jgi:hypothetical protein
MKTANNLPTVELHGSAGRQSPLVYNKPSVQEPTRYIRKHNCWDNQNLFVFISSSADVEICMHTVTGLEVLHTLRGRQAKQKMHVFTQNTMQAAGLSNTKTFHIIIT